MHTIGRKTQKLLAVTVLLNLAALGAYGFLWLEVKAKNEHISALQIEIDAQASEEKMLASVKSLVQDTAPLRLKLTEYFIGTEGAVSFIELLETTGREAGAFVDIASVEALEEPETPAIETLKLTMSVSGNWIDVVRFLGLLEFLPYEARIKQAVVARSEKSPWRADVALYVLKEIEVTP